MTRKQFYNLRHDQRLEANREGLASVPFVDPLVAMRTYRRHYLKQRRHPAGTSYPHPYTYARNLMKGN